MKVIFEDKGIQELIEQGKSKRYKKISKSPVLLRGLLTAYGVMADVECTSDLEKYSFLHYEKLKYQHSGKSSIRIANGHIERLIFRELEDGIIVELIEIDESHYGNKK